MVIAATISSVLNNESSHIPFLNGDDFSAWKDKILLTLGCTDLDFALHVEEPPVPTETSSLVEKITYEKWERSN